MSKTDEEISELAEKHYLAELVKSRQDINYSDYDKELYGVVKVVWKQIFKEGYKAALQNKVSDISAEDYLENKGLKFNYFTNQAIINKTGIIHLLEEYTSIVNESKESNDAIEEFDVNKQANIIALASGMFRSELISVKKYETKIVIEDEEIDSNGQTFDEWAEDNGCY